MNETTKKRIFKDLSEKYPKGPRGNLKKADYELVEKFVHAYDRYTKVVQLSPARATTRGLNADYSETFGYSPEELYTLGIRGEDEAKAYVHQVMSCTPHAAARRGRLVWIRIQDAVRSVQRAGMPGLWKVQDWSAPWGTPLYKGVLVYAEDKASAEAQAFPVLALLGGSTQNCNTHFYGTGTPASATQYNTRLAGEVVRKWEKRIETLEKDLADARASLEEAKVANGRAFAAIMLLGPTEDSEERI